MCDKLSIGYCLVIIVFGVIAPTIDQVSDLALVIRLMAGPEPNITLNSGELRQDYLKIMKPGTCSSSVPNYAAVQYNISEPATYPEGNV